MIDGIATRHREIDESVGDLEAGIAGEHLVCADLILQGCEAFSAGDGRTYDVVADLGGKLLRLQVKAARYPKPISQRKNEYLAYQYGPRRRGAPGDRALAKSEFDLLALVALDTGQIAYFPSGEYRQIFHIRPDGAKAGGRASGNGIGKRFHHYSFRAALSKLRLSGRLPSHPDLLDRSVGTAGEHLVCADLILRGCKAFQTDQSCAFDVMSFVDGLRPARLQVKTTLGPRPSELPEIARYVWAARNNGRRQTPYPAGSFDLLALVAADLKKIAYLPPPIDRTAIYIRTTPNARVGRPAAYSFEALTWTAALDDLEAGWTQRRA